MGQATLLKIGTFAKTVWTSIDMTNLELSLLMGIWPIIYFLIYTVMNQRFFAGKRIKTNVLELRGEIIQAGETHCFIQFDDGSKSWYRNSYFTTED